MRHLHLHRCLDARLCRPAMSAELGAFGEPALTRNAQRLSRTHFRALAFG
jgi:hypothetical protein